MSASEDESGGRTRVLLAALLFVALGGAVLLRFSSQPEVLNPQANERAEYQLDGATSDLSRFLDTPVGSRPDPWAMAADLERSADPVADARRWRDAAAGPSSGLEVLAAETTTSGFSFVLVSLWRGQFVWFGVDDTGPYYLGRACARVTVEVSPGADAGASVTSSAIDCPPDAPMPVQMDG